VEGSDRVLRLGGCRKARPEALSLDSAQGEP